MLAWLVAGGLLLSQAATNPAAELALKGLQLAPGLKVELFAAEPMLKNPVAFSIDERGRVFVVETHRWNKSVFDITKETPWLLNDLSLRTVAGRADFLRRQFTGTNFATLTNDTEVIRLLEDRDADGRADFSEIVATGFNKPESGTAAGILAKTGSVWFANIPDVWRFSIPDSRNSNSNPARVPATGSALIHRSSPIANQFGVHIGVSGHDLHGLVMGPDGRLYFSVGDRGFELRPGTKHPGFSAGYLRRVAPDTGAVFRCRPDGSQLEVFCIGLRNPQELAFDAFGNLFTVDNDTAGADKSRLLHLVEGGDYGWRCSYQHMKGFGPWVREGVWRGGADDVLPTCGEVAQGPAGFAFYPGTGLPGRYRNQFVLCDFPGGVWSFSVKPRGASFEVAAREKLLWNCWPTDVAFGPDGALYVLDWVAGWGAPEKGRIYRVTNDEKDTRAAHDNPQLGGIREFSGAVASFEFAMKVAKAGDKNAIPSVLKLLRTNADADAHLTHAGVMALVGIGDTNAINQAARDKSPAVRRAALLAMRRLESPGIARFLNDPEPRLRHEAARAIHDVPIEEALPELALFIGKVDCPTNLHPRAINACFRLGTDRHAKMLAAFSQRADVPDAMRVEALDALAAWKVEAAEPGHVPVAPERDARHGSTPVINPENWPGWFDRVVGLWRPLPPRSGVVAQRNLLGVASRLFEDKSAAVQLATLRAVVKLDAKPAVQPLFDRFTATNTPLELRREIPAALVALRHFRAAEAVKLALGDSDVALRAAAIGLLDRVDLPDAPAAIGLMLAKETDTRLAQTAFATLGRFGGAKADEVLASWLAKLTAGQVRAELQLDLVEAAGRRTNAVTVAALQRFTNTLATNDPPAPHRPLLAGGDAANGKRIFHEHAAAQCLRCHAIKSAGGTVGPDLAGIGTRQTRQQLVESILFPNRQIAPGFESVTITLANGAVHAGVVKRETETKLELHSPEDGLLQLRKADIRARAKGLSAMPEGVEKLLTRFELRDLVEYLAALK